MTFHRALFLFALVAASSTLASDWEKIDEREGITVFSKIMEGSNLHGYRGIMTIDASAEKLLSVLLDNDHRIEWVDRLQTSQMLERSSPFDYVVYQKFGMPWPVSSRDLVYQGHVTRDAKTKQVQLKMHSVEHEKAPETAGVRAHLHHSAYILTPLADGKTQVEVEIHSDPKGQIPTGLANTVQKSWPYKTLRGLASQVQKPYVEPHALPDASS